MRNTWSIFRHEFIKAVTSLWFLLSAFGLPLASGLLYFGSSALGGGPAQEPLAALIQPLSEAEKMLPTGVVDESGLLSWKAGNISQDFAAYSDEAAARQALEAGKITAYYVIAADYLESGQITCVQTSYNLITAYTKVRKVRQALNAGLLGGSLELARQVESPMQLTTTILEPEKRGADNEALNFMLPYAILMLYYMLILTSSVTLMNSIVKEKENRTLEILMLSVTPQQLLSGKIGGLGLASLLQTIIWLGSGYSVLYLSAQRFEFLAGFHLPPDFLLWSAVYFLLGYAIYASLLAGVGALVPNLRESSYLVMLVLSPVLAAVMTGIPTIEEPNSALALIVSLFPLTAPISMPTRMTATFVPAWQLGLSALLQALTAALVMWQAARIFRAQVLLAGQKPGVRYVWRLLKGER